MLINKKRLSVEKFYINISAEIIAYNIYNKFEKRKLKREYADVVGDTYIDDLHMPYDRTLAYAKAKEILERDYDCDLFSYPFQDELFKDELKSICNVYDKKI